jgi:hypothetical protein
LVILRTSRNHAHFDVGLCIKLFAVKKVSNCLFVFVQY